MTLEEVCLALLYSLLRLLELKLPQAGLAVVLQAICTGPISSWFIPVSTRDVLVGLFDAVTINVLWTLYLRCLCSDLLF